MRTWTLLSGCAATVFSATGAAAASVITANWTGPSIGAWESSSNWSSGSIPNDGGGNTYHAVIDLMGQASAVLLSSEIYVQSVTIKPGDTLKVLTGGFLGIGGGSIVSDGNFQLNAADGVAWLRLNASTVISGTGTLTGTDSLFNRIDGANDSVRLTNSLSSMIHGGMVLGANKMLLTNNGVIDADTSAGIIMDLAAAGTNFNNGTLRASNGSTLLINGTNLSNTAGVIEAAAGSTVELSSSTVTGGTLRAAAGGNPGLIRSVTSTTLDSVSVEGLLTTPNANITRLKGNINVSGVLSLEADGTNTSLSIESPAVNLNGNGELLMGPNLFNRVVSNDPNNRLTIGTNMWVHGAGQFGVSNVLLTNNGLLEADDSHELIMALSGAQSNFNTGMMRAINGGGLRIVDTSINNSQGIIEAGESTFLTLDNCTITGGTVRGVGTRNPGTIQCPTSGTFDGVTIEGNFYSDAGSPNYGLTLRNSKVQGSSTFLPGSRTYLEGDLNIGGTLSVANARFVVGSPVVTLSGTGTTTMASDSSRIHAGALGQHFIIQPEHTVKARGYIGQYVDDDEEDFALRVTNRGVLEVVGSQLHVYADAEGFHNEGILRAQNGNLLLYRGEFLNTGYVTVSPGRYLSQTGVPGQNYVQAAGATQADGNVYVDHDYIHQGGKTEINNHLYCDQAVLIESGLLCGTGEILGTQVHQSGGVISPGPEGGFGKLRINSSFVQSPGAVLEIEIGGASAGWSYDWLDLNGSADIDGILRIKLVNGYQPLPGFYDIVSKGGGVFQDQFDSIEACVPVIATYLTNLLRIEFPAHTIGDFDNSGVIDGADLGTLLGGWGDCPSDGLCCEDLTGDGKVDGADLGTLLGNWG